MPSAAYQVESFYPLVGRLFPYLHTDKSIVVHVRELAISLASMGLTNPPGQEIRVVQLNTGEVIFRSASFRGDSGCLN